MDDLLWIGPALIAGIAFADIEVYGHRGARDIYPENSLPSIEYAISEAGVDVVEFDIHMSKDGELFLNHDPDIPSDRCSYVKKSGVPKSRALLELTTEQINGFDCGSKRDSNGRPEKLVPGTQLPTLKDVLIASQELDPDTVYSIELKYKKGTSKYPQINQLVARVQQVLDQFQLNQQIYLQSFDVDVLKELRRVYPQEDRGIRLVYLYSGEDRKKRPDWQKTIDFIKAEGMDVFSPDFRLLKKDRNGFLKNYAHASRIVPVVPYTLNDSSDWELAARLFHVDGIISDNPAALKEYLSDMK